MDSRRRPPPIAEAIAALDGGPWYRRVEVAALLGVTPGAILAIGNAPGHQDLAPKHYVEVSGKTVYLYTKADIEALRKHFTRQKGGAGRPRTWSLKESQERRQKYDRSRYYLRRADELEREGATKAAQKARAQAEQLRRELDEQLARRRRQQARQGNGGRKREERKGGSNQR